ncbi:hypothetical protein VB796_21035 [Arcicella sp. LKC2W]|uniref:CdiA C-terminal domain-containing protein n=1 Tax=Arcicella sp. LKC2W TaxID=2984198 RepID=UPI002B1FFB08|nr:hypothetical protein [Arcicella sp. LKC2W]MEA5461565.1 hypothetical protein [Arcicella sp. LKC2W]
MLNAKLFGITYKALFESIEKGYGHVQYGMPDYEFVRQLQNSAKYFAARKTALQVIQLTALTADPAKGTKRSWREFKQLAKGVVGNYNQTWLKTEQDTALSVAQSARQWKDFEKTKHLFPNIIYRKTTSAKPDKGHLAYVGIIRAMDDPFWNEHTPPIRWGCKCSIDNTDEEETDIPNDIDLIDPVEPSLNNNAGKTGELFNIKQTTYANKTEHIPDETINKKLRTEVYPKLDFYANAYENKDNGGALFIHAGVPEDEFNLNVKNGFILAKNGYKVKIEPRRFVDGQSDPDLLINGKKADLKAPTTKNAINSRARDANNQGCEYVVFSVKRENFDYGYLADSLRNSLGNQDRKTNIKKVIVHYKDNNELFEFDRSELKTNESILEKLK